MHPCQLLQVGCLGGTRGTGGTLVCRGVRQDYLILLVEDVLAEATTDPTAAEGLDGEP